MCIRYPLYTAIVSATSTYIILLVPVTVLVTDIALCRLQMKRLRLEVSMSGSQPANSQVTAWTQGFWLLSLGLFVSRTWGSSSQNSGGSGSTGLVYIFYPQRNVVLKITGFQGGKCVHLGRVLIWLQFFVLFEELIPIFLKKKKIWKLPLSQTLMWQTPCVWLSFS